MTPPTLDPFHARHDTGSSASALVVTSLILGICTAAGVLFFKWPKGEDSHSTTTKDQIASIISGDRSENSKDWNFYTTEIDNVIQELRAEKEKYETKSKDLIATQLQLEAEKEELARLHRNIESMRRQFTEDIRSIAASRTPAKPTAPTPAPTPSR